MALTPGPTPIRWARGIGKVRDRTSVRWERGTVEVRAGALVMKGLLSPGLSSRGGEGALSRGDGEIAERFENVKGAELQRSLADLCAVKIPREVRRGFLTSPNPGYERLHDQPVLMASLSPLGQIVGF